MRHQSLIGAVVAAALLTACASAPERIYVRPECSVPPAPSFVGWSWDDLTIPREYVPEGTTDRLLFERALDDVEQHERQVVDYALELQAALKSICEGNEND